jgi:hypothetical protein
LETKTYVKLAQDLVNGAFRGEVGEDLQLQLSTERRVGCTHKELRKVGREHRLKENDMRRRRGGPEKEGQVVRLTGRLEAIMAMLVNTM